METKTLKRLEAIRDELTEILEAAGGEGAASSAAEVSVPESLEEINALEKEEVRTLATGLHLEIEGKKTSEIRELVDVVRRILADEECSKQECLDVAAALSLSSTKSVEILEEVRAYYGGGDKKKASDDDGDEDEKPKAKKPVSADTDGEDEDEKPKAKAKKPADDDDAEDGPPAKKKPAADDDEDEDDKPVKKKSDDDGDEDDKPAKAGSDDTGDGIDREAVIAKLKKRPEEEEMQEQLDAYNKAAKKLDLPVISLKKVSVEEAWEKLAALCVNHEGAYVKWGKPYVMNGEACCCGIPLAEVPVKKGKNPQGKCVVTGVVYELDDENEFTKVEVDDED